VTFLIPIEIDMFQIKKLLAVILSPTFLLVASCNRITPSHSALIDNAASEARAIQISASGVDAAEPASAAAPDGSFYVVWVNHSAKQADVMIAQFTAEGEMQGSPVRVNRQPGIATAWRGDQPSVAVAADGAVYVVWTAAVGSENKHGSDLYLSVSNDRGRSFTTEVKINDDKAPGPHGMHSLAVAADGRVYVGWLDERNVRAPKPSAKGEGHHMEANRELFLAYSTDGGRSFSPNRKVASDACPCCKTALAIASDGTLYVGCSPLGRQNHHR
jgi:hypothetical protein